MTTFARNDTTWRDYPTSKLDDAINRGFDPGERPTPTPAHLKLPDDDPWMVALAASVEEAARWAS